MYPRNRPIFQTDPIKDCWSKKTCFQYWGVFSNPTWPSLQNMLGVFCHHRARKYKQSRKDRSYMTYLRLQCRNLKTHLKIVNLSNQWPFVLKINSVSVPSSPLVPCNSIWTPTPLEYQKLSTI